MSDIRQPGGPFGTPPVGPPPGYVVPVPQQSIPVSPQSVPLPPQQVVTPAVGGYPAYGSAPTSLGYPAGQLHRPSRTPLRYFVMSALSAIVAVLGYRAAVGAPASEVAAAVPETVPAQTQPAETIVPIEPIRPAEPTNEPVAPAAPEQAPSTGLRDGTYVGEPFTFRFGTVQVQAVISGGQITDIQVQYPNEDRRSQQINARAVPQLVDEALTAQSANVQMVSGATYTSQGFMTSLQSALNQAQ